jgi:hypothetical protein
VTALDLRCQLSLNIWTSCWLEPDDLLGEDGLFKQLKKAFPE